MLVEAFCAAVFALLCYVRLQRPRNLPPGPPTSILGDNTRDIGLYPYLTFTKWRQKYGNVFSLYLGKTPVIVLGNVKAAVDLLEKRGSIYSSRPRSIVAGEILTKNMRGVGMPYGQRWRNWRSLMHAGMGIEAARGYKHLQSIESKLLLRDLLLETDIDQYSSHYRRLILSVVYCVGYGRRVESLDDKIVIENEKVDEYFAKVAVPGKYLVDSWPVLLNLPYWLQWFRWEHEEQYEKDSKLLLSLMNDVRHRMELGTAKLSIGTRALEKQGSFGLNDLETAYGLSAPFAGGIGTTLANLTTFLLVMLLNPDVLKKSQEELDSVVGQGRLPTFEDAENLPYIQAVLKETLRWHPLAPLGFAHSVTKDDVYEGMFIPKGSTVYSNIHGMTRDTELFPDPEKFLPERFIDTDNPHLTNFTMIFGFGRRICPGMHIAQQSSFILVTRLIWAFDIIPPKDDNGVPILPTPEFSSGLISRPKPFKYHLVPRRADIPSFLKAEAQQAEIDIAAWENEKPSV